MTTFFRYAVWISALFLCSSFKTIQKNTLIKKQSMVAPTPTGGLENIIVETYYVSDIKDSTDTNGGHLEPGSITYRIYVDMAPGYNLISVYGVYEHPLYIATTTGFFNNQMFGQVNGNQINNTKLSKNTVALDSWLSMGAASKFHLGVLKTADPDGSILGGGHNDGGSAAIAGGLLTNTTADLTVSDGLIPSPALPQLFNANIDLAPFDGDNTSSRFAIQDGLWAVLGGVQGPTADNQVLIAQITTTGQLTFELNVQLKSPDGSGVSYVASNPTGNEIQFAGLTRH
jgi:hypothetical protein